MTEDEIQAAGRKYVSETATDVFTPHEYNQAVEDFMEGAKWARHALHKIVVDYAEAGNIIAPGVLYEKLGIE